MKLTSEQQRVMREAYERVFGWSGPSLSHEPMYAAGAALLEYEAHKDGDTIEPLQTLCEEFGCPTGINRVQFLRAKLVALTGECARLNIALNHVWEVASGESQVAMDDTQGMEYLSDYVSSIHDGHEEDALIAARAKETP